MAAPKISREQAQILINAVNARLRDGKRPLGQTGVGLGALAMAAQDLDIPNRTFGARITRIKELYNMEPDWALYGDPDKKYSDVDPRDAEIIGLKDELSSLKAQINSVHRENLNAERVREFITTVNSALPQPPKWTINDKGVGDPGVPVTLWSD
jgi:hypothetical protein